MKDIPGYELRYAATENGFIWSHLSRKFLAQSISKHGYKKCGLYKDGKYKSFSVHRLIACTFIENPLGKPQVNHIDGVKTNNHMKNLEWVTDEENHAHAVKTGLMNTPRGMSIGISKLIDEDIRDIRMFANGGIRHAHIARMYRISQTTVWQIANRLTWKHI